VGVSGCEFGRDFCGMFGRTFGWMWVKVAEHRAGLVLCRWHTQRLFVVLSEYVGCFFD
jgi:hypothetical protein